MNPIALQNRLSKLGINLDISTGHLFYHQNFKPFDINYDLVFVRHGETYGNCGQSNSEKKIDKQLVKLNIKDKEKRIFQGNVDTEINQLTKMGKQQALAVAETLNNDFLEKGWIPDHIFISPLSRALHTALPFVKMNRLKKRCLLHSGIREMSFGNWENQRVCDIPADDSCHLFYQQQHALIKSRADAENFCEVLLRAHEILFELNKYYCGKKILMFSHSMFGAACYILLGKGQTIENNNYLAFDGKRQNNREYTLPHAKPFILNVKNNELLQQLYKSHEIV